MSYLPPELYTEIASHLTSFGACFAFAQVSKAAAAALNERRAELVEKNTTTRYIFALKCTIFYTFGLCHRIGGPAVIYDRGAKAWYEFGRLHRVGGPAFTNKDNKWTSYARRDQPWRAGNDYQYCGEPVAAKEWFRRGLRHRGGDKPARIFADGKREWWRHGLLHRDDGCPAITFASGSVQWWINGVRQ